MSPASRFVSRISTALAGVALFAGLVASAQADDVAEAARDFPEAVAQMAAIEGPADSGIRFVVARLADHDRLFVQQRRDGEPQADVEVTEVQTSGERIVDIRSETDATGTAAFVDTLAADGSELTYELFLQDADLKAYIYQPTSN